MSNKRYWWIKFKEDFFEQPKVKMLRKIAGGDTFTIIYLKLQLLSIRNNGVIKFEVVGFEPEEELASRIYEDVENIKITLNYLATQGLIEINTEELTVFEAMKNIGSEGESAERVRLHRAKKKEREALQCNKRVTNALISNTLISNNLNSNNNINNTTNNNTNSIKYISNNSIVDLFTKLYSVYPRKVGREQALKTFTKKVKYLTLEEATDKCKIIYGLLKNRIENDWANRDKQYIPHCSSWLNSEVPDSVKKKGGK